MSGNENQNEHHSEKEPEKVVSQTQGSRAEDDAVSTASGEPVGKCTIRLLSKEPKGA